MPPLHLDIANLSCASCVGRAERALSAIPGVAEAHVNLATHTATVTLSGASMEDVTQALAKAGYPGTPKDADAGAISEESGEASRLAWLTGIAALLTLPVFVMEMSRHFFPGAAIWWDTLMPRQAGLLIQFALTSLVMFGPGWRFFQSGIPALLHGRPEMNALVALGTLAAWGYSCVAVFVPSWLPETSREVYFEAAAVIITLILLGRFLEARAKGRTGAAIRALLKLQPGTAMVERDGIWAEHPIEAIETGDLIQLRPGERIAIDGTVFAGASFVDESMITGEPVPVEKTTGMTVTAGTLNGTGALQLRATHVGEATVLAGIVRLVTQAQGAKLPIQAQVDRVVRWFVPAVLALAALTVIIWLIWGPTLGYALVCGVSVLIVACPCAMGLAVPVSVMVGSGRAAQMGVLFRKGDGLQALSDMQMVVFDKTGTLTEGRPELTDFLTLGLSEAQQDAVLAKIAAVESLSEHPIAQAILRAAEARGLAVSEPSEFTSVTGMGAKAYVAGSDVRVGAERFMQESGIDVSGFRAEAAAMGQGGKTPFYGAIDGQVMALIGVSDRIKPSAENVVAQLQQSGLRVAMLTGDAETTAQHVADQLGISEVVSGILPDGKLEALKAWRADGTRVAFVGDGINDAPALAEADIGIAVGTGTDVAIETADVVLMSGDLAGVMRAIDVSALTMRNIRQNLFWAFAYNAALLPVAAGVLYPLWGVLLSPMLAAGAMALSSVFVLSNALRLRNQRGAAVTPKAPNPSAAVVPAQ